MRFLSSIHLAVLILLGAIGVGLYADLKSDELHEQNLKVQLGLERMVRLNQSLTNSVAMAVLEKNTLRAASYPTLASELDATVREVKALTQHMLLAPEMRALHDEQSALRAIESEVFALMRQAKWAEAYQVLLGGDYVMSLKLYEINSDSVVGALAIEMSNTARQHEKLRTITLFMRLAAAVLMLWAGWRYSVRLKTELAEQTRLRNAVTSAKEALEEKVQARTAELEAANRQLATLSATDGLTGLANRRRFDDYWAEEWPRALRQGTPLAVIMLDVDHFKLYNDHYGHQQGDDCLRQVGEALRATVRRAGELVARYGGEEFVVVMPGATEAQALETAEAIRAAVQGKAMPHATSAVSQVVTVSLGVAVGTPAPTDDRDGLVQAADKALYDAKHQGRNRVVLARY
ncbi:MAG: hypothetical protein C0445_11525 [Polaromonas sp.]|nr:hypothetical protein [Polaromonas sp.]